MSKMNLHISFEYLKHKLWPKKGRESNYQLFNFSGQESPQFPCVQMVYHIPLESSQRELQLCFRPHLNWRFAHKVTSYQNRKNPNFGNFRTPTWESWYKMMFGC